MKHKTGVGTVGSLREAKPVEEGRFNDAVTLVKRLLTFRRSELIASSRREQINRLVGEVSFKVLAEIAFVCGDDGVVKVIKQARMN